VANISIVIYRKGVYMRHNLLLDAWWFLKYHVTLKTAENSIWHHRK